MQLLYGYDNQKVIYDIFQNIKKTSLSAYDNKFLVYDLVYNKKAICIHITCFNDNYIKIFKKKMYEYYCINMKYNIVSYKTLHKFIVEDMFDCH